ncbi:MAG: cytochrome c [Myxococcota bacterium]
MLLKLSNTRWVATSLLLLELAGCRLDMHDQPRIDPLEASDFFADGSGSRLPLEGTVARGELQASDTYYRGRLGSTPTTQLPIAVDAALLERGQQRYDIFCSPCHDYTGSGQGMVVQRGFKSPPTFHSDRLRQAPVGHFFDVITHGFGAMYSYGARIPVADRWAITAYIRALQSSQFTPVTKLPLTVRQELETKP